MNSGFPGMGLIVPIRVMILLVVLMFAIGVFLVLACVVNRWEFDYCVGVPCIVIHSSVFPVW